MLVWFARTSDTRPAQPDHSATRPGQPTQFVQFLQSSSAGLVLLFWFCISSSTDPVGSASSCPKTASHKKPPPNTTVSHIKRSQVRINSSIGAVILRLAFLFVSEIFPAAFATMAGVYYLTKLCARSAWAPRTIDLLFLARAISVYEGIPYEKISLRCRVDHKSTSSSSPLWKQCVRLNLGRKLPPMSNSRPGSPHKATKHLSCSRRGRWVFSH